MMLGLLLARAGVEVLVLEKHADFLRDFRGDTLHPSTLEVMHELGLLDALLKLPHQKVEELSFQFGAFETIAADFWRLPVRCPYIVLMPQWDFLNFLAGEAAKYPNFRCLMSTKATELIERDDRIGGIVAQTNAGPLEVHAGLVVAADGRTSKLRDKAGLKVEKLGAPIDVLWFRLSRGEADTDQTGGRIDAGRMLVRIFRGDYWQCAYVIAKGGFNAIRERGLDAFKTNIAALTPFPPERVEELKSWNDVKLLTVSVDRLTRWHRPGLLFIGDAAHAMSPVGGVGINLAIQDAVAAANILSQPLADGALADSHLERVQRRREFPARLTQRAQVLIQDRLLSPALGGAQTLKPPLFVRMLGRFPFLRRIPARLVGMGVRPEHVAANVANASAPR